MQRCFGKCREIKGTGKNWEEARENLKKVCLAYGVPPPKLFPGTSSRLHLGYFEVDTLNLYIGSSKKNPKKVWVPVFCKVLDDGREQLVAYLPKKYYQFKFTAQEKPPGVPYFMERETMSIVDVMHNPMPRVETESASDDPLSGTDGDVDDSLLFSLDTVDFELMGIEN